VMWTVEPKPFHCSDAPVEIVRTQSFQNSMQNASSTPIFSCFDVQLKPEHADPISSPLVKSTALKYICEPIRQGSLLLQQKLDICYSGAIYSEFFSENKVYKYLVLTPSETIVNIKENEYLHPVDSNGTVIPRPINRHVENDEGCIIM